VPRRCTSFIAPAASAARGCEMRAKRRTYVKKRRSKEKKKKNAQESEADVVTESRSIRSLVRQTIVHEECLHGTHGWMYF